jgi:beta-fructofuranosidase
MQEDFRPLYHVSPPKGWLNDPNGLCEMNGVYNVFFQYSPESPNGAGIRGWGYATSKDLIHWDYKGMPIKPDHEWDANGAYSGSALINEGVMYLYYTGNVKLAGDYDYTHAGRLSNTILVTSEDAGESFSSKERLLDNSDYPQGLSNHIRDPKVFYTDTGVGMLLGARDNEDTGLALFYETPGRDDFKNFKYKKSLRTPAPLGYMWECPDFFTLKEGEEEIGVLNVAVQGIHQAFSFCEKAGDYRYQNQYQSGYFITESDLIQKDEAITMVNGDYHEWDYGFDFYAAQSFEDEKGRRILWGWAAMIDTDYTNEPEIVTGVQHVLTMPRVLSYDSKKGLILQRWPEEYDGFIGYDFSVVDKRIKKADSSVIFEEDSASGILTGKFTSKRTYAARITELEEAGKFVLRIVGALNLEYDGEFLSLILNKSAGSGRMMRRVKVTEISSITYFVDSSIAEIFINDGEYVLTTRFFSRNKSFRNEIKVELKDVQ